MSWYSCTNQAYENSPMWARQIKFLPAGTLLYASSTEEAPFIFTLDPLENSRVVYRVVQDLPFIVETGRNKPLPHACWDCNPEEVFCFDRDLKGEFPEPCAWYYRSFLYICNLDNLEGPL